MRKTNKKCLKSSGKRSGVLLLTILFITAMALIFITTALTITISTRKRIYDNAKADQARLTVTSLSQAIWNAIYSQQINDIMLENLARGGASNGTLVKFSANEIPGMNGTAGTECSAYFYVLQEPAAGKPLKIAVECKCEIDGYAQYYTMVMEKHDSEGSPTPMFHFTVDLGDAGMLNSCNFGLDASQITGNKTYNQTEYTSFTDPSKFDNIMFIHGSDTTSDQDGSAFYCKLISDGCIYLRDTIFADDVFLVGENASFVFNGTSQMYNKTGGEAYTGPRGDLYFWGTSRPIVGTVWGTSGYVTPEYDSGKGNPQFGSWGFDTVNNIYFDNRALDAESSSIQLNTSTTGFDQFTTTIEGNLRITGSVYYERSSGSNPGATDNMGGYPDTWVPFDNGTDKVNDNNTHTNITNQLRRDPDSLDTIAELEDPQNGICGHESDAEVLHIDNGELLNASNGPATLSHNHYYTLNGGTLASLVNISGGSGDIVIYVTATLKITEFYNNLDCDSGFILNGDGDGRVIFVLKPGATIIIGDGNYKNTYCGFIDTRCFNGTDYHDVTTLNQNVTPRFYIFTDYTGSSIHAVEFGTSGCNHNLTLTAYLGFYPSSAGGNDGCRFKVRCGEMDNVFYGRMACSGITVESGGNLNVPYCPGPTGDVPVRAEAYRDNTDFSVINEECGYFTISNT